MARRRLGGAAAASGATGVDGPGQLGRVLAIACYTVAVVVGRLWITWQV